MEIALAIVLVVVAAAGGWWLYRRRRQLLGGDGAGLPASAGPVGQVAAPAPVLDRDALLRDRGPFNPANWDDTPDAEPGSPDDYVAETDADDLPTYFDRDFLAQRERKDPQEG
jgi:hypothetical protein